MRIMPALFPTIMISRRRRFRIRARPGTVMTMPMAISIATAVFVAVIPCHSVERKGENPDPDCGAHFESSR